MTKREILRSVSKPEEQLVIAKATDSAFLCLKKLDCVFTDFLDPKRVKSITEAVSKIGGVGILKNGGHISCERVIICFYPLEMRPEANKTRFPIKALFIDSSRFVKNLSHRDFLGSLVGLGIDRCKLGDICTQDGNAVVFVREEISEFIIMNLTSVGRAKVRVSELKEEFNPLNKEGKRLTVTVASMRADAVLGEAFNLSRKNAADLIRTEKVFVNWEIINSASCEIKEGDVISARGFGRAEIRAALGKSKKGRVVLEIERFI